VLLVLPMTHPVLVDIDHSLESMYRLLDCDTIQAVYPFEDPVAIVCDDNGLERPDSDWNRYVMEDMIIKGRFFVCGLTADSFADIPPSLTKKYVEMFWHVDWFHRENGTLHITRIDDGTRPRIITVSPAYPGGEENECACCEDV